MEPKINELTSDVCFFEISSTSDISLITKEKDIKKILKPIAERKKIDNEDDNVGAMSIFVYYKEGEIPHFHIKKLDFPDCCLKIKENDWFLHGKNKNKISKKELKLLYKWLTNDDNEKWKAIINEWNKGKKETEKVDENTEVPKYYELEQ